LLHMGTHIDVLVGDYESCVRYNERAIEADRHVMKVSPATAGRESFYFGYVVHDWHMGIYGAVLGGFEAKATQLAQELCELVNEDVFAENEHLTAYLESYSALDVHIMIRFGRWTRLLELELPKNKRLMLFRAASLCFGRGLAFAALGNVPDAKREMDKLNSLRLDPDAKLRILHNNSVADLLAVDAVMLRGEILYREERYDDAFAMLRRAVEMQDGLNYDEPWGKMQPIRHALGGLLLEQGHLDESAEVFRYDLKLHPRNPFALVGLIRCLQRMEAVKVNGTGGCCETRDLNDEISLLQRQLEESKCEWSDFDVVVACECCRRP
jgi:tetratricopeptide (TPR) repeat protein